MIYPSIDKLLEVVDSKYQLVHLVSRRSKQMYDNKQLQRKESEYRSKRNIGRALEELSEGLMHVKP